MPLFDHLDHANGLYPDDVLEVLEDLGVGCQGVAALPKRRPALVAVGWLSEGFCGHYMVWDPTRGQFLDPLHGLVGRRDLSKFCAIEHIWATGKANMRKVVKARLAKGMAKEVFAPFAPASVGLSKWEAGFVIEVRFHEEPPPEARALKSIGGVPIHIEVSGPMRLREE